MTRRPARRRRSDRQVAIVTGASAGVGRAVVEIYARRGWRVGLIAREPARLRLVADELSAAGAGAVAALPADVADAEQVERAATRAEEELGSPEVWINGAMTTVYAPFVELTPAEFERVTRVVYLGTVNGTRAALKRMLRGGGGSIVCVGSGLAYRPIPFQAPLLRGQVRRARLPPRLARRTRAREGMRLGAFAAGAAASALLGAALARAVGRR